MQQTDGAVSLEDLRAQIANCVGGHSDAANAIVASLENIISCRSEGGDTRAGSRPKPVINERNALAMLQAAIAQTPPHSAHKGEGKGVIVCAGGPRMLRCAWVCLNMLRRGGCSLPVEIWHLHPGEVGPETRQRFSCLDVKFVDAASVRQRHPVRILNAWELKPYAILHSSFEEVLLLDADNVPLYDPSPLFRSDAYLHSGALFWPDGEPLLAANRLWNILHLAPSLHASFESGQLVVHRKECWTALHLTVFMNEHSDFFYSYLHGDKDTFHLAWRLLGRDYALIPFAMIRLEGAMCQHDLEGRRLFQHRNFAKWDYDIRIPGFQLEDLCWELLRHYDLTTERSG